MPRSKIRSASGDKRKYASPSPPRVILSAEAGFRRSAKPDQPGKS